jgi:hypothetical protein
MAFDLLTKRHTHTTWSLGSSDDPLVWTPSAVKSEMLRILGIIDLVNLEVSQTLTEGKISKSEWWQWHQAYLSTHQFLTNASNLWGSNVVVARRHEQDALKWRDFLVSRGGTLQGPNNPGRNSSDWSTTDIALAIGATVATASRRCASYACLKSRRRKGQTTCLATLSLTRPTLPTSTNVGASSPTTTFT